MPKILAGIISYNGLEFLPDCINSCINSGLEVLVIDNNSSDGSVNYISSIHGISLIKNHNNIGFSRAANQIIDYAFDEKCDFLLLLNQDTKFDKKMIEQLIDSFEQDKSFAIVSPMHYNEEGELEYQFKNNCQNFQIDFKNKNNETIEVPFVNAACWLIDLKKIKLIGKFETVFINYASDLNYCHRITKVGYKIGLNTKAKLLHKKEDFDYQKNILKTIKTHNTYFLAMLINPMNSVSIKNMYFYLIKKAIKAFVTLRFKSLLLSCATIVYLTFRIGTILRLRKKLLFR